MSPRPIEAVLAAHAPRLMALDGVVIVSQGLLDNGTACIKVGVAERTPALEKAIPGQLEGHPLVIHETGRLVPRGNRSAQ